MGISTLIGVADGTNHAAAIYDRGNGRMLGTIWEADDAEDQIEAFLEWLRRESFVTEAAAIELGSNDLPFLGTDGTDPRHWGDRAFGKLVAYWKANHLDEFGLLRTEAGA